MQTTEKSSNTVFDKNIAFKAMLFAREVHRNQRRKYSGNPYSDHLAEVAGIVATVASDTPQPEIWIATAWLHDTIEDQNISVNDLEDRFGQIVANAVWLLSDMETGNRAARKAASRMRLSRAPSWVQTIKVADMISNTSTIVMKDPNFSIVYLEEKQLLLDVLSGADERLVKIAREQTAASFVVN